MAADPLARARRPRVLFVIGSLEPGGSEGQLVSLLERAHGTRIDAALVALVPAADLRHTRRVERLGLPFRILGPQSNRALRLAGSVRALAGVLRAFRPDLVYPWLEQSALLAAPMARAFGTPVAIARRNVSGPYAERPAPVVAAIHAAERLAVLATANSEAVAAETVRRGIPPERVRVVRNGQVPPPATPLPSSDVVVLGYLARMRPEKGHLRFLQALASLRTDVPWRADLAGDGQLRDEVEATIGLLRLGDRVRLVGPVDDPTAFWRERDVAVLLSDHEGSPNALIEAALVGRPIVATDVGGVPEIVDASVGLLADPDDPGAIAAALARMIEDPALRERMGAAARALAGERYGMDAFVDGQCAAIDEALALAGGPR
jgi:glycosyltransferase involved in cell wall biosynthesis